MYIGIDLGGTNIAAGLVNEKCEIIAKKSIPTHADTLSGEEVCTAMANLALDLIKENGLDKKDIEWVGIGAPGAVDSKNGVINYANNLHFFKTPVAEIFRKTFDIPVFLGNDANCAALGEAYAGAAKDADNAVMITLGTGLGGGIIINKKIYDGFNGAAGELGHLAIVQGGRVCSCGRRGCWEAYSSATGLINMTKVAMMKDVEHKSLLWEEAKENLYNVEGKTAYAAARKGDELALKVTAEYERYLAGGIATIINVFQPEILIIGGGVSHEGDYLLDSLKKLIANEVYTYKIPEFDQTVVRFAELGNAAGIVGAAMLGK